MSIQPGVMIRPVASMVRSGFKLGRESINRSPSIQMSATLSRSCDGSTTRPPVMSRVDMRTILEPLLALRARNEIPPLPPRRGRQLDVIRNVVQLHRDEHVDQPVVISSVGYGAAQLDSLAVELAFHRERRRRVGDDCFLEVLDIRTNLR